MRGKGVEKLGNGEGRIFCFTKQLLKRSRDVCETGGRGRDPERNSFRSIDFLHKLESKRKIRCKGKTATANGSDPGPKPAEGKGRCLPADTAQRELCPLFQCRPLKTAESVASVCTLPPSLRHADESGPIRRGDACVRDCCPFITSSLHASPRTPAAWRLQVVSHNTTVATATQPCVPPVQ